MRRQRDELVAAEPPALRHRAFVSEWMTLGWRAQMMLIAYECAYIGPNGVVWYNFTDMESLESHTRMIHQIMPGHLFRWTINAQPWIGWHVEDEVWWYTYGSRDLLAAGRMSRQFQLQANDQASSSSTGTVPDPEPM